MTSEDLLLYFELSAPVFVLLSVMYVYVLKVIVSRFRIVNSTKYFIPPNPWFVESTLAISSSSLKVL